MLVVENRSKIEAVVIFLELVLIVVMRKFLFESVQTSGVWEWFFFSLVFLLLLPILTIKYIFKKNLADYNIRCFFNKEQKYTILTIVALLLAAVLLIVLRLNWADIFPVFFWIQGGLWLTLFVDIFILSVIVFSTELFFRGYLLSALSNAWSGSLAVVLSAAMAAGYAYMSTEVDTVYKGVYLVSFNLILSLLAYLNRSIILSAVINWIFLISIDLLAIYKISHL